jgi:hypothetical protein
VARGPAAARAPARTHAAAVPTPPPQSPPQCTRQLAAAAGEGRSQGRALHGVAAEAPPGELRAAGAGAVTDLFTDPCGWLAGAGGGDGAGAEGACGGKGSDNAGSGGGGGSDGGPWPASCLDRVAEAAGLGRRQKEQQLKKLAGEQQQRPLNRQLPDGGPACLVFDSLSTLMLRHSASRVGVPGRWIVDTGRPLQWAVHGGSGGSVPGRPSSRRNAPPPRPLAPLSNPAQVLRLLDELQRSPAVSSILALVHQVSALARRASAGFPHRQTVAVVGSGPPCIRRP